MTYPLPPADAVTPAGPQQSSTTGTTNAIVVSFPAPAGATLAAPSINAVLTGSAEPSSEIVVGPLRVRPGEQRAYLSEQPLDLPPTEFAMLLELMRRPCHPVSSRELICAVWPDSSAATPNDVHRHMYRLRTLLGDRKRQQPFIVNRRGFGYVLEVPRDGKINPRPSPATAGVRPSATA